MLFRSEYFLKAADAGSQLSMLLEVSNSNCSAQSKGGISLSFFPFYFLLKFHSFDFLVEVSFLPVGLLLLIAGKVYNYGCDLTPTSWTWNWNPKMEGIGKLVEDRIGGNVGASVLSSSHCSTIERLYAWEKKLYQEVKVLGPIPGLEISFICET